MSSNFTFNGEMTREVYSCTECIYCSTERHFVSDNNSLRCPMCSSEAEQTRTITQSDEMPAYQYQAYLTHLEDEVSGVGSGTVTSVEEHFDNGDEFMAAVKDVYDTGEMESLTCVDGVGDSMAESIARGLAEEKGWEDGLLDSGRFELSAQT